MGNDRRIGQMQYRIEASRCVPRKTNVELMKLAQDVLVLAAKCGRNDIQKQVRALLKTIEQSGLSGATENKKILWLKNFKRQMHR